MAFVGHVFFPFALETHGYMHNSCRLFVDAVAGLFVAGRTASATDDSNNLITPTTPWLLPIIPTTPERNEAVLASTCLLQIIQMVSAQFSSSQLTNTKQKLKRVVEFFFCVV